MELTTKTNRVGRWSLFQAALETQSMARDCLSYKIIFAERVLAEISRSSFSNYVTALILFQLMSGRPSFCGPRLALSPFTLRAIIYIYSRLSLFRLTEVRSPRYTGHLAWHGMLAICLLYKTHPEVRPLAIPRFSM